MNPPEAVKFINTFLRRNNFTTVFPNDISILLSDNRRSRSNALKWGRIDFQKTKTGRITYELEALQTLCEMVIRPICEKALAIKLARASGLSYYVLGAAI